MKIVSIGAVALAALAVPAYAQGPGHGEHGAPPAAASASTASSTAGLQAANKKMHEAMNIPFTGNADVDFVKGMIPHHQGAIDMAKTVLAYGKDPKIKRLAQEIIKAQQSEIALMQAWLKKKNAK